MWRKQEEQKVPPSPQNVVATPSSKGTKFQASHPRHRVQWQVQQSCAPGCAAAGWRIPRPRRRMPSVLCAKEFQFVAKFGATKICKLMVS